MRKFIVAAASMLALSTPAFAGVVYSNDFDGENAANGGATALNYNTFAGLVVTGQVDLVKSGQFSIDCVGNTGLCVDLDGSIGPGALASANSYAFSAGDIISFSFMVSGNQRAGATDFWEASLRFSPTSTLSEYGYFYNGTKFVTGGTVLADRYFTSQSGLLFDAPFQDITMYAIMASAGSVTFDIMTDSADFRGPIVDNLVLDISPSVPEPATWAMMIGGFALVGASMRRRKTAVSFA